MKFCTKCGAQNDDGLAFCSSCGASLNGEVAGEKKPFNVLALIGMIAGILACIWCWFGGLGGVLLGIAAIIMSAIARKKDPKNGMALAGLICGICGLVIGIIFFIICMCTYCTLLGGGYYDLYDYY